MNKLNAIWALPLLGALAAPAIAGDDYRHWHADNRFEQRLDRQQWRIEQGIRSGELTRKEAKRLRKQQRHIAKMERKFERDGRLDRYERRTLRRELDDASARIYRLKHNDRYRDRGHKHKHDDQDDGYRRYSGRKHAAGRYDHDGWSVVLGLVDRM